MQSLIDRKVALTFLRNGDMPAEAITASRPRGSPPENQPRQHDNNSNYNNSHSSNHNNHQPVYGGIDAYGSQSQQSTGSERSRSRSGSLRKSGNSLSNMSSLTASSRGTVEKYDPGRGGRTHGVAPFYNKLN